MKFTPRPLIIALSAGTLLFTACSSDSDSAAGDTPAPVGTVDAESATFNDADVTFAQAMIPHHRGAVAMAEMALAPETEASAEIQTLATQIQGAQDPEIEQLTGLLESWGQPVDMPGMEGMDDMEHMDGMMSAEEMEALGALTGSDFDSAWALAMIVHHEGALTMSETVKASGSNPEVLALADAIIAGQQAEIEEMKVLTRA